MRSFLASPWHEKLTTKWQGGKAADAVAMGGALASPARTTDFCAPRAIQRRATRQQRYDGAPLTANAAVPLPALAHVFTARSSTG